MKLLLEYQIYACYISTEVNAEDGFLPGTLQCCFTHKLGLHGSWSLTMSLTLFHKSKLMLIFSQHLRQGSQAPIAEF